MLKKILLQFWAHRVQFSRYFITGFSAFLLDIGSLFVLREFFHLSKVVAVALNQLFLLNYVFVVNKYWSFKALGVTHHQMVRFYLVAGANVIFSIGWMWFFTELFHVDLLLGTILHQAKNGYLFIRTCNIALAVAWNFVLYKYWVYASDKNESK